MKKTVKTVNKVAAGPLEGYWYRIFTCPDCQREWQIIALRWRGDMSWHPCCTCNEEVETDACKRIS